MKMFWFGSLFCVIYSIIILALCKSASDADDELEKLYNEYKKEKKLI